MSIGEGASGPKPRKPLSALSVETPASCYRLNKTAKGGDRRRFVCVGASVFKTARRAYRVKPVFLCRLRNYTYRYAIGRMRITYSYQGEKSVKNIDRSEVLIGRLSPLTAPDLDLGRDSTISRKHARIKLLGGECWIEDLNSTNGTLVDGVPIQKERLKPESQVVVGDTVLEVDWTSDTKTGTAQPSAPLPVAVPKSAPEPPKPAAPKPPVAVAVPAPAPAEPSPPPHAASVQRSAPARVRSSTLQ